MVRVSATTFYYVMDALIWQRRVERQDNEQGGTISVFNQESGELFGQLTVKYNIVEYYIPTTLYEIINGDE